jgi:hypothetical protein
MRARIAAGEIRPSGAVVGHEQRVTNEDGIADLVGDVGRGLARYVEDFDLECADGEALAILGELRLKTLALRSEKYRPTASLQLQGPLDTRMPVPPMATTLGTAAVEYPVCAGP